MRVVPPAVAALLVALCPAAWGQGDKAAGFALVDEAALRLDAGRAVDAFRALRRAQEIAASHQADDLRGAVLAGQGDLYSALTEPDRAKSSYAQSLPLLEKAADRERLARALNGIAWLELLGTRYPSASGYLTRAQGMQGVRRETQSATLRLLSELQARSGDLGAARQLVTKAMDLAGAPGSAVHARALAQRARLAARASAYREAFELWEAALARFRELKLANDAADALANLADLYFLLGLVEESKPRYEAALKDFLRAANGSGEARTLVRLARVEQRMRRPDLALAHAEQALDTARKKHDYVSEAEALVELGEIWIGDPVPQLQNLPNAEVAQRHLRAAREIYKDAGDRGAGAGVWLRSGAIQLRARQFRIAAKSFELVVQTARELGDEDLLWQALRGEALALGGSNELAGAALRFEEAIEALERVYARTAGLSQDARSSFLGDRRGIYEEYVDVLIRMRGQGGGAELDALAFALSERAKSRQFTEMLAAGGAERAAASADPKLRQLVARERAIRSDLAQLARAIATPGAQAKEAASFADRVAMLGAQHQALLRQIESEFPRYAELLQPRPVSAGEVQAMLQPGETLLSYFVGARVTAAFVLTRERIALMPIEVPRRELRALVDRFRRPFANLTSFADLARWGPADAHALYQRTVEPLAGLLARETTLIIAADDALYTLPFEALLRNAPTAAQGQTPMFAHMAGLDWLGDLHPIVYVPSAGALRALRAERPPGSWRMSVVAFADPDFGEAGVSAARGISRSGADAVLARLPETADEVRAVTAIVKGESRIFLRREAAEAQAKAIDLSSTRYLMFSTHGLLGGEISAVAEPALALTLVGNPPGDDGFLSMSEVLSLKLGADIVVLSACNTAGEPDAARIGEGFAGLTRSFMYAGARSLVVSHWPVGSQATAALMTAFFEELAAGKAKPAALARARQRLRGIVQDGMQLAHPFFWAPFVIVGEPR